MRTDTMDRESPRETPTVVKSDPTVEKVLTIDISKARNSAQSLRVLEEFLQGTVTSGQPYRVDLLVGDLLLTQKVLAKMGHLLVDMGLYLHTVYTTLPQTQQAALDGGFYVKEKPRTDSPREAGKTFLTSSVLDTVDSLIGQLDPGLDQKLEEALRTSKNTTPITLIEDAAVSTLPTLYIKQTLRSGQVIRAEGHVIIVGDVHGGAEVSATGDILIWGELKGVAHAGTAGNYRTEIRAIKIEAVQLRIADYIARRPDRVFYHKDAVSGNALHAPEFARVSDGEIKIFKELLGR